MKDIICPKCGTPFHIDESTYANILSQVRNREFDAEVERRLKEARELLRSEEDVSRLKAEQEHARQLSDKDLEISGLKKDIAALQGALSGFEARKKSDMEALEAKQARDMVSALAEKDRRINELSQSLSQKEGAHKLAILEARNEGKTELNKKEQELAELRSELRNERLSAENRENQLREQHKIQLEDKQGEIDRLKDFKLRLSTKMVGETLEQHCFIQFSQAQSMGMYPGATFEKDNIAVEGSKGDFIFRDYIDGTEYISVMFEMKNEMDATQAKHRNDDFLDKLDKDRQKKNCEYAVLVSMLEQGNELYDTGIVDKGHRYPRMLVIRPQFFLPVLRLLTEGARRGFTERRELLVKLEDARNQSVDLSKFQDKLDRIKNTLSGNYQTAHKKFLEATEGIDKAIAGLEKQIELLRKVRGSFEASDLKLLRAAELGEDDLTIKKLTHGIPSVRKMIEDAL